MDASDVDAALSAHLTRQSRKWRPQVAVRAPGLGMDHHYGPADLPCHSASTGKLATTALVMQLVEQGELRLGTPVVSILEPDRLQGIFRDDRRDEVTVEQLLTHTSGANDYLNGPTTGPTIAELATSERDRRWHPEDLLDHARNNQRPIDAPGEKFFYSDNGFIVLGLILEAVTATPFSRLVHDRILDPLGMTRSFMPRRTTPAFGSDRIAPLHLGRVRVDDAESLTIDWAGGGLAATPSDHLTLINALHTGRLISPESWAWMTKARHRYRSGLYYGAGAMEVRIEGLAPWLRGWPRPVGHLGITAAHLWHVPELDAEIVINFSDSRAMRASFITLIEIIRLLRRLR